MKHESVEAKKGGGVQEVARLWKHGDWLSFSWDKSILYCSNGYMNNANSTPGRRNILKVIYSSVGWNSSFQMFQETSSSIYIDISYLRLIEIPFNLKT